MKKRNLFSVFIVFFSAFFFTRNAIAQYDISILSTTVFSSQSLSSVFSETEGMVFSGDGTKLFVVGNELSGISNRIPKIAEYALSSTYDISSAFTATTTRDISTDLGDFFGEPFYIEKPTGVTFNEDGTKLFVTGITNEIFLGTTSVGTYGAIAEYSLSSAYDISSYISHTTIYFGVNETPSTTDSLTEPESILFDNDGDVLLILNNSDDLVYEFILGTPYSLSTISAPTVSTLDVSSQETDPKGMTFNNTGTALFVIGQSADNVNEYTLSTPYTISSATYLQASVSESSNDTESNALAFNSEGTELFILGSENRAVYQYSIPIQTPESRVLNYIGPTSFDIDLIPSSPSNTLSISSNYLTNVYGARFNKDGTKIYLAGNTVQYTVIPPIPIPIPVISQKIVEYTLAQPYDISSTPVSVISLDISYHSTTADYNGTNVSFGISRAYDIYFTEDGSKMYVIGRANLDGNTNDYGGIMMYSLNGGSPFNLTDYSPQASVVLQAGTEHLNNARGMSLSYDGYKLFVVNDESVDKVYEYVLDTPYDISSGTILTNSYDISGEETNPTGIDFNYNGTSLFVIGTEKNSVYQYRMTSAYNLSTVNDSNVLSSPSLSGSDSESTGVHFNTLGSQLFVLGNNTKTLYEYGSIPVGDYQENDINDGSLNHNIFTSIKITGDTFASDFSTDDVTVGNIPDGLTPVFSLSQDNTLATLTFTGNAINNTSDDIISNLTFTFDDSAFTNGNANTVSNATSYNSNIGIIFIDCGTTMVYDESGWVGGAGVGNTPTDSDIGKGMHIRSDVTLSLTSACDCLVVNNGATLTVDDGFFLMVANDVTLNGDLVLLGNAQLKQNGTGITTNSGSGTLKKDRTTATTTIYQSGYWTSPVSENGTTFTIFGVMKDGTSSTPQDITFTPGYDGDGTTVPITISNVWLHSFKNTNSWTAISENDNLSVGEGFNMKGTGGIDGNSTQKYTFVGTPNDGDYTLTIEDERYFLVGNPYPSALDANEFINDNADAIGGTLYFYESGTPNSHNSIDYNGGYATYNGVTSVPFNNGSPPGQYIPVGQGFFVYRNVDEGAGSGIPGQSANIVFLNSQRALQAEGNNSLFLSRTSENSNGEFPVMKINMQIDIDSTEAYTRQIAVGFLGLTRDFENGYDAPMLGIESTDIAFSVNDSGGNYSIIGIEEFSEDLEIPLKVFVDTNRTLAFSLDSFSVLEGQEVYLKDKGSNTAYDIYNNPVQINLDAGTYLDRFSIIFSQNTLQVDQPTNLDNSIRVFYDRNRREINIKSMGAGINMVSVYNILGQPVGKYSNMTFPHEFIISTEDLLPSVYLIQIRTATGVSIKKIVIE